MHNIEKALQKIEKYRLRVENKEKRPRGNPPEVLDAMRYLRGMTDTTWCETCGNEGPVELHHVDGNWKNYTDYNLRFDCKPCHRSHHGELIMNNVVNWSVIKDEMIEFVNSYVANGDSKSAAFREFAAKMNGNKIKGYTPVKEVNYQLVEAAYYKAVRDIRGVKPTKKVNNKKIHRVNTEMTLEEAFDFYNTMLSWGITIK